MASDWLRGDTHSQPPKRSGKRVTPPETQPKQTQIPRTGPRTSERRQRQTNTSAHFYVRHPNIFGMIVAVAISTSVLLACLLWKGWDLWVLLWQHKKWLWGMVLAPVGLVGLKMLGKQYGPEKGEIPSYRDPEKANGESAAKRNGKMAPPGEGWMQSAGYVLTHLGMWLYNNRLVRTVAVIAAVAAVSSGLAHTFYEGVRIPGLKAAFEERKEPPEDMPAGEEVPLPEKEAASPEEDPPEEDGGEPEIPTAFLLEPGRYYVLSSEEEEGLFFQTGSYAVAEGASASDIAEKIKPFIEGLLAIKKENVFDQHAPEDIKGEIADASRLEGRMTNSGELDQVITVRMDVWAEHPKYRIAKLLANNMQTYAQKYTEIDGKYETIKYYHGQSIFWTWRSLTFASVTSYTLKNDLDYVRMRYHDIADAATSGSEDQIRASALSEAFRLLENMEFSLEKAAPPDTGPQDSGISEYE